ncbi:DUF4157 domain-containing protein [Kitasatospora aburaviensis]
MTGERAPRAYDAAPSTHRHRAEAVADLLRAAPRGADGEAAERHADAVAEALLPLVETALLTGPQPAAPAAPPTRRADGRERDPVPPTGRPAEPEAAAGIGTPGEPLSPPLREAAQAALGVDLEPVRLHRGAAAEDTAAALGSRAYAFGAHVVLGAGWDGPGTASGRRLLAHELAHVAVQAHQCQARVQHETAAAVRAPAEDFDPADTGSDPARLIGAIPGIFSGLKTIRLDENARAAGVSRSVLQPAGCFVYTENYIVVLRPDGAVREVFEQDTSKSVMFDAPVLLLSEARTGLIWFVGLRGGTIAIQSFRRYATVPKPDRPGGESVLLAFLPGVMISSELARSLRRRARAGPAPGRRPRVGAGRDGQPAQAPDRGCRDRWRGCRWGCARGGHRRRGHRRPLHRRGFRCLRIRHRPGRRNAGRRHAARSGDVRGRREPDRGARTQDHDRSGVHHGPAPSGRVGSLLDRRVKAAEQALQESRDPSRPGRVAGRADTSNFAPPPRARPGWWYRRRTPRTRRAPRPAPDPGSTRRVGAPARTPGLPGEDDHGGHAGRGGGGQQPGGDQPVRHGARLRGPVQRRAGRGLQPDADRPVLLGDHRGHWQARRRREEPDHPGRAARSRSGTPSEPT